MERELKDIVTPVGGHKVVLKAWITGREKRAINSALLDDSSMIDGKYSIDASNIDRMKDEAIKNVIVSINGSNENVIDTLLDMRSQDYDFVIAEIDEITSEKKSDDDKKKLKTNTTN
jgi:hypothetical protein